MGPVIVDKEFSMELEIEISGDSDNPGIDHMDMSDPIFDFDDDEDFRIGPLSEDERRATAYHEAAHVVAALVFGIPIIEVYIGRSWNDDVLGAVKLVYELRATGPSHERRLQEAIICLAGPIAEYRDQKNLKRAKETALQDKAQAHFILEDGNKVDYPEARRRTKILVDENWSSIETVARELQKRGELTYDEVRDLVRDRIDVSQPWD